MNKIKMKNFRKLKFLTFVSILVFLSSCERDNFTDPNDPRFGSVVDTSDATGQTPEDQVPDFATSNLTTEISVSTVDGKAINPRIYGVNNDWRRIKNGMYPAFQAALEQINYELIRFPGGFESEFYDWSENTTPGWPNSPAQQGATIETVKASNPNAISIVVPIRLAMLETLFSSNWEAAVELLKNEAEEAITRTGANNILSVELGNEWWLQFAGQGVEREDKLKKYGEIAKRLARHINEKFPDASFKVLVNGDYTQPDEFTELNQIFGTALDDIDGLILHTYTGYDSESHDIRQLQANIDACQTNLGKSYLSLSEWAPSKAYNNGKIYAQGANLLVEQMYEHALAEADEAAFWPPTNPAIPGLGLFNFQLTLAYPTAQLFGDMASDFRGEVLNVTDGTVRAAAALQEDGTMVVYVIGKETPFTTVTLNLDTEISEVVSAQIWQPGNLVDTAEATPMTLINEVPYFKKDNSIVFNINEESLYTIYKLVLKVSN
ncbi:hypothetical protein [Leeuwenhoekiella sp. MAR_2009_132]|uniref:hypothetical protein n=1 Tax=Leeuwenhoekiella sp. MAR_2009_132 TaxID=1392489 RepID=UPI0004921FD0|nr:hypothetical protein [Leeuwenhoekiella sp. MAR_2009_132]